MFSFLKTAFLKLLVVVALVPAFAFGNDFKVVASIDFKDNQISKKELADLYLGNIERIEDRFVVQKAQGPLTSKHMEKFLSDVLGMTSRDYVSHWKVKLFSSRGRAPKTLQSDEEVVFYLHATPQSLGIVSPGAPIGNIKVLTVVE